MSYATPPCPTDAGHGRAAEYMRSYNARPEVKERDRARRQRPDEIAKRRLRDDAYRQSPWGKAVRAARNAANNARRFGVGAYVSPEVYLRLMAMPCAYCGADPAGHVDHVIPLAKGGPHAESNMAPSCDPCNRAKHARDLCAFQADVCPRGHSYAEHGYTYTHRVGRRAGQPCRSCRACRRLRSASGRAA